MRTDSTNYMWWMSGVFVVLTLSFMFNVWGDKRDIIQHPLTEEKHFTKQPVREVKLEPTLYQDGYMYRCNDCHKNIEPSTVQKSFFSAHPDIVLEHGANNYCLTCHNVTNRETFTDLNHNEIPFTKSHQTCLQCHGPIYRDWEKGVHGRMNDFWDSSKGEIRKLSCVACHDPHQPKFKPMKPAPGPNIQNLRKYLQDLTTEEHSHE